MLWCEDVAPGEAPLAYGTSDDEVGEAWEAGRKRWEAEADQRLDDVLDRAWDEEPGMEEFC